MIVIRIVSALLLLQQTLAQKPQECLEVSQIVNVKATSNEIQSDISEVDKLTK